MNKKQNKTNKNLWVEAISSIFLPCFSFLLKENGRRALSCHSNNDVNLFPFFVFSVYTRVMGVDKKTT